MGTYDAVGAGAATTAGARSTTAFKKTEEIIFQSMFMLEVEGRAEQEVVDSLNTMGRGGNDDERNDGISNA